MSGSRPPVMKRHLTVAVLALATVGACRGECSDGDPLDQPLVVHADGTTTSTTWTDPALHYDVPTTPPPTTAPPRTTTTRPSRGNSNTRPTAPPPDDIWRALAMCESTMRQDAIGEGVHYSYFQWKLATWRSVKAADDPDDPRDASYDAQVAAAKRLQARSGWGQWPACSRKLGLQ